MPFQGLVYGAGVLPTRGIRHCGHSQNKVLDGKHWYPHWLTTLLLAFFQFKLGGTDWKGLLRDRGEAFCRGNRGGSEIRPVTAEPALISHLSNAFCCKSKMYAPSAFSTARRRRSFAPPAPTHTNTISASSWQDQSRAGFRTQSTLSLRRLPCRPMIENLLNDNARCQCQQTLGWVRWEMSHIAPKRNLQSVADFPAVTSFPVWCSALHSVAVPEPGFPTSHMFNELIKSRARLKEGRIGNRVCIKLDPSFESLSLA